jgi:HSP20 family protein
MTLPSLFTRSRLPRPFRSWNGDDLFEFLSQPWSPFGRTEGPGTFNVDVKENSSQYLVTADLPGVEKDGINVELNNQTLTISVRAEQEKEEKGTDYLLRERWNEARQRSIPLALAGSPEGVSATFKNGVLEIKVPKNPEHQSKRISIQ